MSQNQNKQKCQHSGQHHDHTEESDKPENPHHHDHHEGQKVQHVHSHGQCHEHGHQKMEDSGTKFHQKHTNYSQMDSAPQTFFYTLTNLLQLDQSHNILQVGCGAGKLLSTVLDLKKPETLYHATDVSEGMVQSAKKRLSDHFAKYLSKIQFQEWVKLQNLSFQVQDGECLKFAEGMKFDRIIANMVLCHANDPEKMLKNWRQFATEDCLLGISLLGDPEKNKFIRGMRESIQQSGEKPPQTRPPYYWYDKISKIVEGTGWDIILDWQQCGQFPALTLQSHFLKHTVDRSVPQAARPFMMKKFNKMLNEDKTGIQVWSKMIIAKYKK